MTPEAMAQIHARAFPAGRAWSASEIAQLVTPPGFACTNTAGFAIGRAIAGEAELIMLAVDPAHQGHGHGRALLRQFEATCAGKTIDRLFLEVAADNSAAIGLYDSTGWQRIGLRKAYYRRQNGPKIDAILMEKRIP